MFTDLLFLVATLTTAQRSATTTPVEVHATEPSGIDLSMALDEMARAHDRGDIEELTRVRELLSAREDRAFVDLAGSLIADLSAKNVDTTEWSWSTLEAVMYAVDIGDFELARMYHDLAARHERPIDPTRFLFAALRGRIAEHDLDLAVVLSSVKDLRALVERNTLEGYTAPALASLGALEFAIADHEACTATWNRALALAAKEGDFETEFMVLCARCDFWRLKREFAALNADAERLVAMCEAAGEASRGAHRYRAHFHRGSARLRTDDIAGAGDDFNEALGHSLVAAGGDSNTAAALDGLALVALERGDLATARRNIEEALALERKLDNKLYLLDTLQTAARLELASGNASSARAAALEAGSILESAGLFGLGVHETIGRRARYSDWSEIEQDIAAAEFATASDMDARAAAAQRGFTDATRWTGRSLALSIGSGSNTASVELTASLSVLVPKDAILVHYANGRELLRAYVFREGRLDLIELGERRTIETLVTRFTDNVLETGRLASVLDVGRVAHELHELLLRPALARAPEESRRLLIVATADLARLPFDALVRESPRPDATTFQDLGFVVDRWTVSMLPSALLLPREVGSDATTTLTEASLLSRGAILLYGDPTFGEEDGARPARLPWSRREVLSIVDALLPTSGAERERFETLVESGATDAALSFDSGLTFRLGGLAKPSDLLAVEGRIAVLHLATHTRAATADPSSLGVLLAPDANGDAVLDLAEIRSMHWHARLVVLSACSTATGPVVRGDGLQSLASAFLERGTDAVVASLCPVADDDACLLLCDFHRALKEGFDVAGALRQAKLSARRSTALREVPAAARFGIGARASEPRLPGHPRSWASFVHLGH